MATDPAPERRIEFPRPVPAKASVTARLQVPEYLPARMLNEFVYCPRLFFYEWVEGVFAQSADTVDGSLRHQKLGTTPEELRPPSEAGESEKIHVRSVTLSSDAHHVIATIDLVEGEGTAVMPVDYKRGRPREGENGPEPWPADEAQVSVQALVLRDNGFTCAEGVLYYNATKQRVHVKMSDDLLASTTRAIADARAMAERGRIPPPLVDSAKCPRCSLVGICLPDETAAAMGLPVLDDAGEQLGLFEAGRDELGPLDRPPSLGEVRRLLPARDDLRPLYVMGYGLTIGRSGEVLQVRDRKGLVQEARLGEISQVNVFGTVSVTAPAVQLLCWAEKPIGYFSQGGWFYGFTQGLGLKNVFLRRSQFRRADDERFCLRVAREIVATKIRNQRTLLQRNHIEPPAPVLERLKQFAQQAKEAEALDELLGIEGAAARLYFENFSGMIKTDEGEKAPPFDFRHRNRRPPRDPVNALLSFAYSLLTRDLTIVCASVGFDPFIGFYHQPRFGRPALALDLVEGFRPLVADSAVLTAVNTRMVTVRDFISAGNGTVLTPDGRTGFIRSYAQRMDALVTHPLFGYRVNYRRVLEIQARLLARVVTGELARYPGFETR
jgi:CRISPR-associated protein Cas1